MRLDLLKATRDSLTESIKYIQTDIQNLNYSMQRCPALQHVYGGIIRKLHIMLDDRKKCEGDVKSTIFYREKGSKFDKAITKALNYNPKEKWRK